MRLKWGKVTSLRVYCDTQVLADVLRQQLSQGIADAGMTPIVDSVALARAVPA